MADLRETVLTLVEEYDGNYMKVGVWIGGYVEFCQGRPRPMKPKNTNDRHVLRIWRIACAGWDAAGEEDHDDG